MARKSRLKIKGVEGVHDFHLDDLKNQLNASPLKIWPKAIPQTLFCRMYLCDFFIHGIGGGVYEEVVDLFFKKTTWSILRFMELFQRPIWWILRKAKDWT